MSIRKKIAGLGLVAAGSTAAESTSAGGFQPPIKADSIAAILTSGINFLTGIAALVALLALIWGGIRLVIAFGDEKAVSEAKQIIKWSVIGLAVVILSFVIVNQVVEVFGGLGQT